MKSLQQILHAARRAPDQPWALATLVRTEGSTYRKPGARLLVSSGGEFTGVLSGGCLEEEIARHGLEVIANGIPQRVSYDTRRLFGCEGKLDIFIEKIEPAGTDGNLLTRIGEKLSRREICRTRTDYGSASGKTVLLDAKALVPEEDDVFVQMLPLPVRLLVFGTGPEIPPLRLFAAGLGWVLAEYAHPDELPLDFESDDQTAAIVMTHQFGRDLAAIDRLLPLELSYLGLLGPRRRQAELLRRLQEFRELDPAWLDRLHAPAGLDIGSEAPEEIALSIVSEAAAVLARRAGGFLRERPTAIHAPDVIGKEA